MILVSIIDIFNNSLTITTFCSTGTYGPPCILVREISFTLPSFKRSWKCSTQVKYLSHFLVLKILKVLQKQLFRISSICLHVKFLNCLLSIPIYWFLYYSRVFRESKQYNPISEVCDICRFFFYPLMLKRGEWWHKSRIHLVF